MKSAAENALEFRDRIRKVALGKLLCRCGNKDWEQYIYIAMPNKVIVAGCKRCGHHQNLREE